AATTWKNEPMCEPSCAANKNAKTRCRSGAQADGRPEGTSSGAVAVIALTLLARGRPGVPIEPTTMADTCTHLGTVADVTPSSDGCVDCERVGGRWVHLRLCVRRVDDRTPRWGSVVGCSSGSGLWAPEPAQASLRRTTSTNA